jgi:hypothetical protein
MPANQHAIASGWNVPLLDLDPITDLVDGKGNILPPPRALGTYDVTLEPRGTLALTAAGVQRVSWVWDQIERSFRKVLRVAYCGPLITDHSGQVTIYTPFEETDEYYLCNAWVYLPPISALNYDGASDWYERFVLQFVIEEILDTP